MFGNKTVNWLLCMLASVAIIIVFIAGIQYSTPTTPSEFRLSSNPDSEIKKLVFINGRPVQANSHPNKYCCYCSANSLTVSNWLPLDPCDENRSSEVTINGTGHIQANSEEGTVCIMLWN